MTSGAFVFRSYEALIGVVSHDYFNDLVPIL
jgi:hypothetical protein